MRAAIVALLCFAAVVAADNLALTNDDKCKGKCMDVNTKGGCSGGSFVRGLCMGKKTIQCCVPAPKPSLPVSTNGVGTSCGAGGVCQLSASSCAGEWKTGLCPNAPANVKCCQPKAAAPVTPTPAPADNGVGKACGVQGKCQLTNTACGGEWKTGLCQGTPANVKCCQPKAAAPVTPTPTPATNGVGKACGVQGKCQLTSTACAGEWKSNLCPGTPGNVKCCQPKAAAPVTPAPADNGVGKACGVQGKCQLTSTTCGGEWKSNLCPGTPANVKCCQPKAAGPVTPTPSASPKWAPFNKLWQTYPHGEAGDVKRRIGGGINADYITNTCVVRVTRAMSEAGMDITPFKLASGKNMLLVKGGNGKNLALRVKEFNEYIRAKYGKPSVSVSNAGDGTATIPPQFLGKKGVIMFDVRIWDDATGHFDIWDGKACAHNCYFDKARQVFLWEIL